MIADHLLDRIREATDAVELISAYVKLRKRGQHFVGLCPFHTEKTPSFTVNRQRQIFHCFGCGRGGDVFKFLMEHERLGFVEAVTLLAERAHIELEPGVITRREETGKIQSALQVACDYFTRALQHERVGLRAREYLASRKVGPESVTRFGLGYAPAHRRGLLKYSARFGVTPADLEAAGLLVSTSGGPADRFRDRLMFPISSPSGKPIGFGGRDLSGQAQAKYMNSPETALYQKSRVLFGLPQARESMQKLGRALLCEGYFDLLRLHESGFTHAVAVSGTALSSDQARLLKRHVEEVVLLFDSDEAGAAAALRSFPVLFDAGLDVLVASLPKGTDPDAFLLEHGPAALESVLKEAASYVEFLETRSGGPFRRLAPGAAERFLREVAAVIAHVQDPVRRDLLVQAAWSHSGIPEARLRDLVKPAPELGDPARSPAADAKDWREELLCLLVARPDLRRVARSSLSPTDFELPLQRQLLSALLSEDCLDLPASSLGRRELSPPVQSEVVRLASLPLDSDALETAFTSYLNRIAQQRLGHEAQKLVEEIAAAERRGDPAAARELSERHGAVRREWLKLGSAPARPSPPE